MPVLNVHKNNSKLNSKKSTEEIEKKTSASGSFFFNIIDLGFFAYLSLLAKAENYCSRDKDDFLKNINK